MVLLMTRIRVGGCRREVGHFNPFLPSFPPFIQIHDSGVYIRGVWQGDVIVTFSFRLESVSLPTIVHTWVFPLALQLSRACQPNRHLSDYQQLETKRGLGLGCGGYGEGKGHRHLKKEGREAGRSSSDSTVMVKQEKRDKEKRKKD